MKAKYDVTIKVTFIHDVDTIENVKDPNEMSTDLAQMICDEATFAGVVACCDVIETRLDVR